MYVKFFKMQNASVKITIKHSSVQWLRASIEIWSLHWKMANYRGRGDLE
jgi:hypothetical protein